jgi:hypothetical protein
MKRLLVILSVVTLMSACKEPCKTDFTTCKFKKGGQVEILNKTRHNTATVTDIHCGCNYTINYYSSLGTRRHRLVTEVEIKQYIGTGKDGYTDEVIGETVDKIINAVKDRD